jgi:hypothetical protein
VCKIITYCGCLFKERADALQNLFKALSLQQIFGEWAHYSFTKVKISGMIFSLTVTFKEENISSISLSNEDKEYGLSWEDWTLEKEMNRKKSHEIWLSKVLGEPPYRYKWGNVESFYDSKGGFSHILIRYLV